MFWFIIRVIALPDSVFMSVSGFSIITDACVSTDFFEDLFSLLNPMNKKGFPHRAFDCLGILNWALKLGPTNTMIRKATKCIVCTVEVVSAEISVLSAATIPATILGGDDGNGDERVKESGSEIQPFFLKKVFFFFFEKIWLNSIRTLTTLD